MSPTLRWSILSALLTIVVTMTMGIYLMSRSNRIYSLEAYGFEKKSCSAPDKYPDSILNNLRKYVVADDCDNICTAIQPEAGLCVQNVASLHSLHCLPSLLIVGAMKSGTGTMMKWLNEHPRLQSGLGDGNKNEVHFFPHETPAVETDPSSSSCAWMQYIQHFAVTDEAKSSGNREVPLTFDKSPDYMRSSAALEQIHHMLPSAKILALLREPVRRTISAFNHNCKHQRYGVRRGGRRKEASMQLRMLRAHQRPGSDLIPRETVVQLEWIRQEATQGNLVKCVSSTSCMTLSVQEISSFYEVVPYPCQARHFHAYYNGSVLGNRHREKRVKGEDRIFQAARNELSFGFYDEQLEVLLRLYVPPSPRSNPGRGYDSPRNASSSSSSTSQVEIFFQEHMVRDTAGVVSQALRWLRVSPFPEAALHRLESSQEALSISSGREASRNLAKDVQNLYPNLVAELQLLYLPHNNHLQELLHRYFGADKNLPSVWSTSSLT